MADTVVNTPDFGDFELDGVPAVYSYTDEPKATIYHGREHESLSGGDHISYIPTVNDDYPVNDHVNEKSYYYVPRFVRVPRDSIMGDID